MQIDKTNKVQTYFFPGIRFDRADDKTKPTYFKDNKYTNLQKNEI